jgi:hypothetical protein
MSVPTPRTLTPTDVFGPDAAALLAQVQAVLAPQHHDLLDHLLGAVDTHVCAEQRTDEAQRWSALLAHIPGYAPTLHVLRAHIEDSAVGYCPGGAACRVVWPCPA